MFHRMLTILLIGATLVGPSICCCTMKVEGAESDAPACCCPQDSAAKHCPGDPDGENGHPCPCRENQTVGARLDDNLIVQASASLKWITERFAVSDQALIRRADYVPPQDASLFPGKYPPLRAGKALLIAHGVSRC